MAERDVRERDIRVASNELAYVQGLTKGDIVLYVGPGDIRAVLGNGMAGPAAGPVTPKG